MRRLLYLRRPIGRPIGSHDVRACLAGASCCFCTTLPRYDSLRYLYMLAMSLTLKKRSRTCSLASRCSCTSCMDMRRIFLIALICLTRNCCLLATVSVQDLQPQRSRFTTIALYIRLFCVEIDRITIPKEAQAPTALAVLATRRSMSFLASRSKERRVPRS